MQIREDEVVVGEFDVVEKLPEGTYTFRIRKNNLDEDKDVEISIEGKEIHRELPKGIEPTHYGALGTGKNRETPLKYGKKVREMIKEITEGSTLSREELIEEMKKKREEYNGLLTRAGALFSIKKELEREHLIKDRKL